VLTMPRQSNTWKQGPLQIGQVIRQRLIFYLLTHEDAGGYRVHWICISNWHLLKKKGSRRMLVDGWKTVLRCPLQMIDFSFCISPCVSISLCPCASFFLFLLCAHTHTLLLFSRLNTQYQQEMPITGLQSRRFF